VTGSSERLLIAALAWGALSFGAVYPWAYWPLAVTCAALGIYGIVETRAWTNDRIRKLAIGLGAVGVAIATQTIDLPYAMTARLSPGVDRFLREYSVAYQSPATHALSIDAGATLVVLGLFAAFAIFLLGLTCTIRYTRLNRLMTHIMVLGLALSVIGVVQKALIDPVQPLVYGFWKPLRGGNPFGPFINRNHFAGWMIMALPLVAGYSCAVLAATWRPQASWAARLRWLTTVEASQFVPAMFCAVLMGMALALTGSRSGIAGFAVAMLVFAFFAVRRVKERRSRVLVGGYLLVILVGAIVWAGTDMALVRFLTARSDSPGRLLAWHDAWHIATDFPLFGTGLGTFGKAMLVYQTASRPWMYAQAHNDYLQLIAEGGALVVIPSLVVVFLVLAAIRRRLIQDADQPLTRWIRIGAIAGLAGIAAQSAVEFSLQMPGNAVLFVLLLAIAMHRPRSEARHLERVKVQTVATRRHAHRL
jgi:O-antigen ligase